MQYSAWGSAAEARRDSIAGRILVVDDIEANRDALSRRLTRYGHDVQVAADGAAALSLISEQQFDLVLLDVLMPGIDGWSVLERVRKSRTAEELPVIMATALGESQDVVRGLKLGANDYISKPLDFPIVRARVRTQLALKQARDRLAEANRRMKQSLEAAAHIQRAGLPNALPEISGYRFGWRFRPCDELAGDGLNIQVIDPHSVIVCLWDVSGHGVPAALLSVSIAHVMNDVGGPASAVFDPDSQQPRLAAPHALAARLNDIFPMVRSELFFTLCYGILDTRTGIYTYASAGHCNPIHVRADGTINEQDVVGLPIGIQEGSQVRYEERKIRLQPGDRVYLYSDGLAEERNVAGKPFGGELLDTCCQSLVGTDLEPSLDILLQQLESWHGSARFSDDVTVVAFERTS